MKHAIIITMVLMFVMVAPCVLGVKAIIPPIFLSTTYGNVSFYISNVSGPIGPNGSQGIQGIPGVNGSQGIQGIPGVNGSQGPTGAQGPQGINGTNGIDGVNGTFLVLNVTQFYNQSSVWSINTTWLYLWIHGLFYDKIDVDALISNISLTPGPQGINGTNGVNGLNGTNGINGLNGTNGINGTNGVNGTNGINGTNAQLGHLVGFTTGLYNGSIMNGSLVGYVAANNICNKTITNSHLCATGELLNTIITNTSSTGTTWFSNGPPGYTANANDCLGFTSSSNTFLGAFWDFDATSGGGAGYVTNCAQNKVLACCGAA